MTLAPRTKLALSFAVALAAILAGFAVAVYVAVERALIEATDEKLRTRIDSVEHGLAVDDEGRLGLAGSVTEEEPFSPLTEVVRLRDRAVVYHSDDLEDDTLARTGARPRDLLEWKQPRPAFLASGHEVRLMAVRASSGGQDLSRADRPGGLPLEREAGPLDALARDVCDRLRPVAAEREVALACAACPDGAAAAGDGFTVDGDRARLRELLENLVDNAVKYTDRGGRVDVRLGRERGAIVLEVADTGAGIAPERLPPIFERFYRADPARSRGGSGLGLSIVRAIVDAHGGSVDVRSEVGKGTTFTARLPVGRGEA